MEKLPKYNIVKNNLIISICYELKYFIHLEFSLCLFYIDNQKTLWKILILEHLGAPKRGQMWFFHFETHKRSWARYGLPPSKGVFL